MQYSNEKEYWSVGYNKVWDRWQVMRSPTADYSNYELVEVFSANIKTICIEFDGEFYAISETDHFSFVSEELPRLFIVTLSGTLYTKYAVDHPSTSLRLAQDVIKLSVVRGWRNDSLNANIGFIVAYLKSDGKAYYREYAKNTTNDLVWLTEECLEEAGDGNTDIQVLRLNDFRVGIFVEGCNKLFISKREYLGGTSKTEYSYIDSDNFLVTPFRTIEEPADSFQVLSFTLRNNKEAVLESNYPICSIYPDWENITLGGTPPEGQGIKDIWIEDGKLVIELNLPITNSVYHYEFLVSTFNRIQYEKTPQCRPVLPVIKLILENTLKYHEHSYVNVSTEIELKLHNVQYLSDSFKEYSYVKADSEFEIKPKTVFYYNSNFKEYSYVSIVDSTFELHMKKSETSNV